jgi:hypothetical protein
MREACRNEKSTKPRKAYFLVAVTIRFFFFSIDIFRPIRYNQNFTIFCAFVSPFYVLSFSRLFSFPSENVLSTNIPFGLSFTESFPHFEFPFQKDLLIFGSFQRIFNYL